MKSSIILALFSATLAWSQAASAQVSRLLPESVTRTIALSWKQDGRVAELQVANPSGAIVLESIDLEVAYEPVPPLPAQNVGPTKQAKPVVGNSKRPAPEPNWEAADKFLADLQAKDIVS